MKTDTSEKGLESLIIAGMTFAGWIQGDPKQYDREFAVDLVQLTGFVTATQPELVDHLDLPHASPARRKFLARLQGEITKRGIIDVLRHGVKHGPHHIDLLLRHALARQRQGRRAVCAEPLQRHAASSATAATRRSSPSTFVLFINGLPVATFELKNSLTKQTVEDAVQQYQRTAIRVSCSFSSAAAWRISPWTISEVRFCTQLKGKGSWFLPFNQGWNDGAGNPPNPDGLKTDYLWKRVLTPQGTHRHPGELRPDRRARRTRRPGGRSGTRSSRATTSSTSSGSSSPMRPSTARATRYLIQHSAGSGKSNSIAWLAHQLIGLKRRRYRSFRLDHRRHRPPDPRQADPGHDQAVRPGGLDRRPRRALRRPAEVHRRAARRSSSRPSRNSRSSSTRSAASTEAGSSRSSSTRHIPARADRPPAAMNEAARSDRGRRRRQRCDSRIAWKPARCCRTRATSRSPPRRRTRHWKSSASRINDGGQTKHRPFHSLHDEAGDPGRLHPRRPEELHAGRQLLQAGEDGRGRPRVRH